MTITSPFISGALSQQSPGISNIILTTLNKELTESAMVGFDATIGYQPTAHLEAFAGTYYYHSSNRSVPTPSLVGGLLRARYSIFNQNGKLLFGAFEQVALETQLQYDHIGKWRWYGGIRCSISAHDRKLSRMQRHMVEQAMRDLDVVVAEISSTSITRDYAKNSSGADMQVNQVSTTTAFNNAIGDTSVDIIAVDGVITDANSTGATLAEGQIVSGGTVTLYVNGQAVPVEVASGGELVAASAANLLSVSKNNTISDITLTMTNPPLTNGNKAIYNNTATADLGTITIENVTSNGQINIDRNASGQTGTIVVTDCNFTTPASWNPTDLPAVGQFQTTTDSNLVVTIKDSTFKAQASTQQVVGLRVQAQSASKITVTEITNCNIDGSDGGLVIGSTTGSTITINGDIAGNTIDGGSAAQQNESGVLYFLFSTPASTIQHNGALINNTITATSTGVAVTNFSNNAGTINLVSGIVNNVISSTNSDVILVRPQAGTYTINNLYGNTINRLGANTGIHLNGSNTTINVGRGSTGLSAANGNTSINVTGTPTVNPGL